MKKGQVSEIWNSKVCDSICNGKYDYVSENYVLFCRFGVFPSWGLSQKLSRIIGPNRAREISLSATPILADQAERWGLVNHVVEGSQILIKARQVAEAIIKNNQDLVLKYKAVINDGFKQDLSEALKLEKVVYLSFFFKSINFVLFMFILHGSVLMIYLATGIWSQMLSCVPFSGKGSWILQWDDQRAVQENARIHIRAQQQETCIQDVVVVFRETQCKLLDFRCKTYILCNLYSTRNA